MSILNNTTRLQGILEAVNSLPEAGGAEPILQDKTITPTINVQTVNADEGYDGLDTVTVNAMPTATRANTTITTTADDTNDKLTITASNNQATGYVTGANKTATTTITLSASGATVTASDGTNKVSKSVATATQATPSISVNSSGLITASATQTAGYVSAGTKSATKQLTTQAAKTVTPTESAQTAVAKNVYTTGVVSVGAIPSEYIVRNEINEQDALISNIMSALEGKAAGGSGNGEDAVAAILDKTISGTYTNSKVTRIGDYAFRYCTSLTSVSFPACINIDIYAFQYCSSLTSVNFPVCTTIGGSAFQSCSSLVSVSFPACTNIQEVAFTYCYSLTTANFPACTSIDVYAFDGCRALTSVNFPVCTSIDKYAFRHCSSLTSASFPACKSISAYAFYSCSSLTSVNFPVCTTIGSNAFGDCHSLTSVNFPACTNIQEDAFYDCRSLTTASFPVCIKINSCAFEDCRNLISLYLTSSSLCTLNSSNAFNITPIGGYSASAGKYGSIYVPSALLSKYQSATNWTYFSSRFVGLDIDIGGEDNGNLITFTINSTEYQADEGMTWEEWCNSGYNIDGYIAIKDDFSGEDLVIDVNWISQVAMSNGTFVLASDVIMPNHAYNC